MDLTGVALAAHIELARAAAAVAGRLRPGLARRGLTGPQFAALAALLARGPLSMQELAAVLRSTPGNLTLVVDNLERGRLAERRRSAENRRCIRVHLTAGGRERIESALEPHREEVARAMAALTSTEQEHLAGLCRRLAGEPGEDGRGSGRDGDDHDAPSRSAASQAV